MRDDKENCLGPDDYCQCAHCAAKREELLAQLEERWRRETHPRPDTDDGRERFPHPARKRRFR